MLQSDPEYLSRMSAMMQEYISSPSGNWIATLFAFACFSLHTVLCIYRKTQMTLDCFTKHARPENKSGRGMHDHFSMCKASAANAVGESITSKL